MEEMLGVGLRISISYVYVLAMMRISGKRSVGSLSPFDLMIALVIGDMFDDIFWGDLALSNWLVGLTTILILDMLVSYGTARSSLLSRIFGSRRAKLVRAGAPERQEMARERISDSELSAELRLQGLEDVHEVRELALEPNGQVSVFKQEEYEPVLRKDSSRLRRAA